MKTRICETEPSEHFRRLKPKKRVYEQSKSSEKTKFTDLSANGLLSSISSKLNPKTIEISSENKVSSILFESQQFHISCIDQLTIPSFTTIHKSSLLDFEELRRKGVQKKMKNWFAKPSCSSNHKKICTQSPCPISSRWLSQLISIQKQSQSADQLRQKIAQLPKNQSDQIEKDAVRSFPDRSLNRTKLTVYQTHSDKKTLVEMLKVVLKMLVVDDPEVGYVQGMNLYAAIIVSHMKDITKSFIFIKQIMMYGNFRKLYINNFKGLKQKAEQLLHRHIKLLMRDLYDHFMEAQICSQLFMPFYLTMFTSYAECYHIPVIIDQFLSNGFEFLDKLILSLFCYMKEHLLSLQPEEARLYMGPNQIRQSEIPWEQIINLTQAIQLNQLN